MPYVLTLTVPTFDSYTRSRVRMYASDERGHGGCGGGCAEDTTRRCRRRRRRRRVRRYEPIAGVGVRFTRLSSTSADAVGKRVYRSVSYHLLSLSLPSPGPCRFSVPSLLTFVTAVRDAPTPQLFPPPPYRMCDIAFEPQDGTAFSSFEYYIRRD